MSKRKPLPYHAGQAVDEAKMAIAVAIRELSPLIKGNTTAEDRISRTAQALHNLHLAKEALLSIRRQS